METIKHIKCADNIILDDENCQNYDDNHDDDKDDCDTDDKMTKKKRREGDYHSLG